MRRQIPVRSQDRAKTLYSTNLARLVVIGCDGLKSRVREYLFGMWNPISYPRYSGEYAFRGLVTMADATKAIGTAKAKYFTMHLGPGAHLLHYPVANDTMVNVVCFVTDTEDEDWTDSKNLVKPATRADLERALQRFHPALRALASVFPERIDKWGLFDHWDHPAPFYNRRNICLVGDAAHASTPHHGAGACLGVEDAACISALLAEAALSLRKGTATKAEALTAAFQAYDTTRRKRCAWFVESSRRVSNIYSSEDWASATVRAEVRLEEVKDRSHKIWHFDPEKMVEGAIKEYLRCLISSQHEPADLVVLNGKQAQGFSILDDRKSNAKGTDRVKPNGTETTGVVLEPNGFSDSDATLDAAETRGPIVKPNAFSHFNGTLDIAETRGPPVQPNGVTEPNGLESPSKSSHVNGVSTANGAIRDAENTDGSASCDSEKPNGIAHVNGHGRTDQTRDTAINKAMATANAIPTVDISQWLDPKAPQEVKDDIVKQVHDACSIYGFFNLVGHGVSKDAQERTKTAARRFFNLSMEEKMKVSVDKSMGKSFRGFEPPLLQKHKNSSMPDTKEVSS